MWRNTMRFAAVLCRHLPPQMNPQNLTASLKKVILKSAVEFSRPARTISWSRALCSAPKDYGVPNPSWSAEMMSLYERYSAKGAESWERLPSYKRYLTYSAGGQCLSRLHKPTARLFTRNLEEEGAGFEYTVFANKAERRAVCLFQAGPLLEGPPGHVHGGAIATIIDSATGICATYLTGFVMTANLNINYRNPIPLGSVVLVECELDRTEGRKTFVSCRITSADGSKLHAEATALFVSVSVGTLIGF
ncbi:acyl-coenzyme A thioesterase THEM4-like isoform X1 [Acipenser ruthenus]|uniref:acyl-coenzyme A thioesterase THEM4-like isoform X1 n=2 Tax=Acipenser ruthenus TaxID=7906 RepID=UPI002740F8D7|nr:acyl-coenzyme A thioesterase THEM4-like isoform X1 [Acipenser ruthenus]XP_058862168.1 acyl-coenzyme A thioesterase THEM4-like isoform X1 [Acipenser ruthenus]